MERQEALMKRQIAEILKKTSNEESISAPTYNPKPRFEEEVAKWRRRLFPAGAVVGAVLTHAIIYKFAPGFYNPGNAYYIGTLTLLGVGLGITVAEGSAYGLADASGAI